jgi:acyl transferase domain-containing protein/acyl carrier protein
MSGSRSGNTEHCDNPRGGVAIVGLSGRYPGGATSPAKLWDNLRAGIDGVGEARGDRWDLGYHHPDPTRPERVYTRACGLLEAIDEFDHEFFSISPREARQVDPQQRLLLELAYEALEDAAIPLEQIAGSDTGVFIGISSNDYASLVGDGAPDAYSNTGVALSIAANRISYVFDLHGPSFAVDTACSSSIVGLHQACQSLLSGECSIALAGGVSLLIHIRPWLGFAKASMLSPTGRCKSFDAGGDGYVRSEGGGVVVLKKLADAERDGDFIYGVIVGSAVNSDGHTMGLAMPNIVAQERLMRGVYERCGIPIDDVVYVEAHGTGTAVGDPVECESIARVLGMPRADGSPCMIGSVKSNIGHLEAASGMAGLTKSLLALRHREIPANLHFTTPNPKIKFDEWNLTVVTTNTPLPERERPVIIGLNSFGFGGTNAHLAISEYRRQPRPDIVPVPAAGAEWDDLLLLSAASPDGLRAVAQSYVDFLRSVSADEWRAICAAAATCRSTHRYRLALSAPTPLDAVRRLEGYLAGEPVARLGTGSAAGHGAPVAFVFSGNGPQWWGMGRELLAASADFRREIERIDAIFFPLAGWSLAAEMQRPEEAARTALTEYAQPLLFALQVALTRVLASAGIEPAATLGHSVGEVAAAYAAGALTLEAATHVIYYRSLHQARTAGTGRMAAIGVSWEAASAAIGEIPGWLELAASNAPAAVTVAGDPIALETLRATMTEAGKFARILPLAYPFHTSAMDVIKRDLLASLAELNTQASTIPFVSTVEARECAGTDLDATYWWRNVREPVRFAQAVEYTITECGIATFLEIGPHPVLRDYIVQCAKERQHSVVAAGTLRRPAANRPESDVDNLWSAVCSMYASGAGRPATIFARPNPVPALPTYPWQRSRHWRGETALPNTSPVTQRLHPLLGYALAPGEPVWENTLDTHALPYLLDHVVQDSVVFPAAGYIECALTATRETFGDGTLDIDNFEILRPLTIASHTDPLLQLSADPRDGTFEISSRLDRSSADRVQHVRGRLSRADLGTRPAKSDLAAIRARLPISVAPGDHYRAAKERGLAYGPAFAGIVDLRLSAPGAARREALAEIHLPELTETQLQPYRAHPALTDSGVQVILSLVGLTEARQVSIIPVFLDRIRSYAPIPNHFYCSVVITRESERSAVADFQLFTTAGERLTDLTGVRCQKVDFGRGSAPALIADWWRPDPTTVSAQPLELPEPQHIRSAVDASAADLADEFGRPAFYRDIEPLFDALAGAYAARALLEIGAATAPFSLNRLMRRGRIKAERKPLLAALIAMATADGQLQADESGWTWNEQCSPASPDAIWQQLLRSHPRYLTELQLIAQAGEQLAARLRGEDSGTADPAAGVDPLFDTAPFASIYNRYARHAIAALVQAWPSGRPIRVLEIGGGGGGLTAALLPMFPAHLTDYVFTDASEAAVGRAERRFAAYSFVRSAVLDLDRSPETQGQPEASFDLIIAGNVLGSVPNVDVALTNVAKLLCAGGQLLTLEHHDTRFAQLVFGRDPAWWQADGGDLDEPRPSRAKVWRTSLERAGFDATVDFGDSSTAGGQPQQTLFLSRARSRSAPSRPAAATPSRRWLVLSGDEEARSAAMDALETSLVTGGHSVAIYRLSDDAAFSAEAAEALISEHAADSIVFFAGFGLDGDAGINPAHPERVCAALIAIVRAIEMTARERSLQLTIVTRGALASPFGGPRNPGHAPVWGLGRVISNEHPTLGCRLIDLDADRTSADAGRALADELLRRDAETEVLLRDGGRYVSRARLTSAREDTAAGAGDPCFRLDFVPAGGLDSLHVREVERRAPGPRDVEIRVGAAGLNFRDVLWAMGMLPEEAVENGFSGPTIGMECAGEIVRVGSDVHHVRVGDRVIAFASSCFSSFVTTDAASVARIPATLDFDEAATIPITFLTAFYALDHLARVAPGETVLIHGAAGGVGLAAIQIAKLKGARVIGTAGSPAKRRLVELAGADHVLNSRSLEFADDVFALTAGAGVDIVLNSLAGEAITKGLAALKPFGRFLEIGKRDLYANSRIGLRPFRQNLSYFGIDADTLLVERADLARRLFAEVMALFAAGELHPLPFVALPVSRATEAFRMMQQSRHVGKIVITMRADRSATLPIVRSTVPVRNDGTYLVTGGLGGFGLATARWLVANGARSLALVGRSGAASAEAQLALAAMADTGAVIRDFAADVADPDALAAVIDAIRSEMPPLRGVIHAAAVIEDAPILNITSELLDRVLEPKSRGAWNLHHATLTDSLDFFVLYSSASVLVGNPGQGAYVAANLQLEALAQHRRAAGLPALAVGWGAIKDAGFLTRNAAVAELLKSRSGMEATPAAEALAELGRLLASGASRVYVAKFNFDRLGQMFGGARAPRLAPICPQGLSGDGQPGESLADRLASIPEAERRALVLARIAEHAGRVLGVGTTQLDAERSLTDLGLDSLMAVELAEAVGRDIGQPISVMQMLSAGSIGSIADLILKTCGLAAQAGETTAAISAPNGAAAPNSNGLATPTSELVRGNS